MARTTKQLSGGGKDKFLRGLITSEAGITPATAKHLGDSLCSAITDVRVRRDTWEHLKQPALADPPANAAAPAIAEPTAPVFDPFAFSALAVLAKKGPDGLATQLAIITSATDLHALALAQHLSVDVQLTDLDVLRAALLAATQARLAERRAAAS